MMPIERPTRIPACPNNWHILAYSSELARGATASRMLAEVPVTLYRTRRGDAVALVGKCAHMGCDLRHAAVVDGGLMCPLHKRVIAADGAFMKRDGSRYGGLRQRSLPVREQWGAIFAFAGEQPDFALPEPRIACRADTAITKLPGRSFSEQPWWALVGNGLDMEHLHAVHDRKLMETPSIARIDPHRLELTYRTAPTGKGLGDRIMRRLAAEGVRGRVTCVGGSMLLVETEVGRREAFILLSMTPTGSSATTVHGVVGVSPGGPVRAWIAGRLFMSFLKKDLAVLEGYRASEPPSEETVGDSITRSYYAFIRERSTFSDQP